MTTNRGTFEGNIQEIEFVRDFNKNKYNSKFLIITKEKDIDNLYMVRVTTNQFSTLSNTTTKTRADCYLIYCYDNNIHKILNANNFYLCEENLKNLKYKIIEHSGISIKLQDSEKYQILKTGPKTFNSLFGCYELGAGASLFCLKEEELVKNQDLLVGWNTSSDKMKNYFSFIPNIDEFLTNKNVCQTIKSYCNNKITEMIDNSKELQQKIFNGYPIYKEPYSVWYIFSNNKLDELKYIPFTVTTGSGRSHGSYTIVLKPKREG